MNVTVFGATGVIGRALIPLLAEHDVTAVSRSERDERGARYVVADAARGEGVPAALEDADVVYYLVHSLGARDFEEQDRAAAETVAREASKAGCDRSSTWEGSVRTTRTRLPICAAVVRRASGSPRRACR